ncbi:MAG: hypothetical protein QG635_2150 [Bacteroidota bacterium]|nr:hypothetical protein [Bacteroidota bacterium]
MQSFIIPIIINNEGIIFISEEYLNKLPKDKILKATVEIPDVY